MAELRVSAASEATSLRRGLAYASRRSVTEKVSAEPVELTEHTASFSGVGREHGRAAGRPGPHVFVPEVPGSTRTAVTRERGRGSSPSGHLAGALHCTTPRGTFRSLAGLLGLVVRTASSLLRAPRPLPWPVLPKCLHLPCHRKGPRVTWNAAHSWQ